MKVRLAKTAGFCMGVRRAMEIVFSELNKGGGRLFTYGPLIHNRQVLELLRTKGVEIKERINEGDRGRIIIRAHGITPDERKVIKASNLKLIDATCPKVAKVQAIIKRYCNKGYVPVIFGDKQHPEVTGLMGYSGGRGIVIGPSEDPGSVLAGETEKGLVVVSQTTQNIEAYEKAKEGIREICKNVVIFDTICNETCKRQRETKLIASRVHSMVVVGGYNSGNTKRLYHIAESAGKPAFHVETEKDLRNSWFSSVESVGVTAGASTPNWMIKKVTERLKKMGKGKRGAVSNFVNWFFQLLAKINVLLAAGAFTLTYAGLVLSRGETPLSYPLLASLYVYSMHIINRFLDKGASSYNDPGLALFYSGHRGFLLFTSVAGIGAGIMLSWYLGPSQFIFFVVLAGLGVIYSMPIIPLRSKYLGRYAKIKDLPGSKAMAEALAWGIISSALPYIAPNGSSWAGALSSFLFVSSMCYIRSGLFDIINIQGDLIVGMETLPVALGQEKSVNLLLWLTAFFGLIILFFAHIGEASGLGYLVLLCYAVSFSYLFAYKKTWLKEGRLLQLIAEGNLLLAGLLAFIWNTI